MIRRNSSCALGSFLVALLGMASVYGCSGSPDDPMGPYQAEADAAVALAFAVTPQAAPESDKPDTPDQPKPGDQCRSCKGRGKVGDGRVMRNCRTCGGDGRIDERDIRSEDPVARVSEVLNRIAEIPENPVIKQPSVNDLRTVTIYLNNRNFGGWPKQWWLEERPKLVAAGFSVHDSRDWEDDSDTPAYTITVRGDRETILRGPQTAEDILRFE